MTKNVLQWLGTPIDDEPFCGRTPTELFGTPYEWEVYGRLRDWLAETTAPESDMLASPRAPTPAIEKALTDYEAGAALWFTTAKIQGYDQTPQQLCETGRGDVVLRALRRLADQRWLEENREAIGASNRYVEKRGLPLANAAADTHGEPPWAVRVFERAVEVHGGTQGAMVWMWRPHPDLDGQLPVDIARESADGAERVMWLLDHGPR